MYQFYKITFSVFTFLNVSIALEKLSREGEVFHGRVVMETYKDLLDTLFEVTHHFSAISALPDTQTINYYSIVTILAFYHHF
jgi:hypothetical protein